MTTIRAKQFLIPCEEHAEKGEWDIEMSVGDSGLIIRVTAPKRLPIELVLEACARIGALDPEQFRHPEVMQ